VFYDSDNNNNNNSNNSKTNNNNNNNDNLNQLEQRTSEDLRTFREGLRLPLKQLRLLLQRLRSEQQQQQRQQERNNNSNNSKNNNNSSNIDTINKVTERLQRGTSTMREGLGEVEGELEEDQEGLERALAHYSLSWLATLGEEKRGRRKGESS
jgi:hypothetical protein